MNRTKKITRTRLVAALVAIAFAGGGVGLWTHIRADHGHGHSHAGHGHSVLALNDGKRWPTDEPLRAGMRRIREASDVVSSAQTGRPLTSMEAKTLATSIQEAVKYLMQNCRLEPKADATLHVLITDLMTGAGMLAENPSSVDGSRLIADALQLYPQYFDDPGWSSPSAGEPHR